MENKNKRSKVTPDHSHAAALLAVKLQGLVEALGLKGIELDSDMVEAARTGMLDL